MEDLFLKTDTELIPLNRETVRKYALRKGVYSPFSHLQVVDKNGDFTPRNLNRKKKLRSDPANDKLFSVAETLDIAEGADS